MKKHQWLRKARTEQKRAGKLIFPAAPKSWADWYVRYVSEEEDMTRSPSTPEGVGAQYYLLDRGYHRTEIISRLEELVAIIAGSFHETADTGLTASIYPANDQAQWTGDQDVTSYTLDHLLANVRRCKPLGDLFTHISFEEFAALLLLQADLAGDRKGVSQAHTVLLARGAPYKDRLKRSLGMKRSEIRERNDAIREEARALLADRKSFGAVVSILAKRHNLGWRQVRRILDKEGKEEK